jgi:hypothetical protein
MTAQPAFSHFILTRFNTQQFWSPGGTEPTCLEPLWLAERFRLFEALCLPSVSTQTVQNFTWLVFAHTATPTHLIDRLTAILPRQARLILTPTAEAAEAREAIGSPPEVDYIITTRLDNDDALSRDYVALSQTLALTHVGRYLNFPTGAQLDWRTGRVSRIEHRSSPFLSRVEGSTHFGTVWEHSHVAPELLDIMVQIPAPPMWLQGIHGRNVSNPLKNGAPLTPETVMSLFDVDPRVLTPVSRTEFFRRSIRGHALQVRAIARSRGGQLLRATKPRPTSPLS